MYKRKLGNQVKSKSRILKMLSFNKNPGAMEQGMFFRNLMGWSFFKPCGRKFNQIVILISSARQKLSTTFFEFLKRNFESGNEIMVSSSSDELLSKE